MILAGIMSIHAEDLITENIKLLEPIEINNGDVASDTLVPMAANSCPLNAEIILNYLQVIHLQTCIGYYKNHIQYYL